MHPMQSITKKQVVNYLSTSNLMKKCTKQLQVLSARTSLLIEIIDEQTFLERNIFKSYT